MCIICIALCMDDPFFALPFDWPFVWHSYGNVLPFPFGGEPKGTDSLPLTSVCVSMPVCNLIAIIEMFFCFEWFSFYLENIAAFQCLVCSEWYNGHSLTLKCLMGISITL